MTEEYLTINQVAALLKVNHKTIRKGIKEGRWTAIRIGKLYRLPAVQFEAAK